MTVEFDKSGNLKFRQVSWSVLMAVTVLGSAAFSASSMAQTCSTDAWDATQGGTVGFTRYVGQCGYRPSTTTPGQYVQDNIDPGATTYIASFYAFTQFSGGNSTNSVTLFEASNNGASPVVSIAARADGNAVLTTPAGTTLVVPLNTGDNFNGWNHYKLEWTAEGQATLTVNGSAANAESVAAGTGTLTRARLGHVASSTPNLTSLVFDQFVSLREDSSDTNLYCPGNVDGDTSVDADDARAVLIEELVGAPAGGQADFNGDGAVDADDARGILITELLGGPVATCTNYIP